MKIYKTRNMTNVKTDTNDVTTVVKYKHLEKLGKFFCFGVCLGVL